MSKLEFHSRPLVAFDARNQEHRSWYYTFLTRHTWGHCPVRFICPEEMGWDLPSMIQKQLLEYYTQVEFGAKKKVQKAGQPIDKSIKRPYNKSIPKKTG